MVKSVLPAEEEAQLLAGLKTHSRWAFRELYDRYAPTLLGVLIKMVKDESQAHDLLQDSMIKIWQNSHRHDPTKGRLFTWILNVTRNTAIDFLRAQKNTPKSDLEPDTAYASVDHDARLWTQPRWADSGFHEQIAATLSPRHWQVIDLIYFQGYTQQEVSQELSLPLGTVKTWTRIALGQLKAVFRNDEQAHRLADWITPKPVALDAVQPLLLKSA